MRDRTSAGGGTTGGASGAKGSPAFVALAGEVGLLIAAVLRLARLL